jgi:hypothetical protein
MRIGNMDQVRHIFDKNGVRHVEEMTVEQFAPLSMNVID